MPVVTGVVSAAKDGKRFQIDGEWYGSYNPIGGVNVGDTVTFNWDFDKTGKYRNIGKGGVSVITSGGGSAPSSGGGGASSGGRDAVIVRQNALAHATALVVASGVSDVWNDQRLVIALADGFARYSLTGEIEENHPVEDGKVPF